MDKIITMFKRSDQWYIERTTERLEQHNRELAHDLTNVAARVDVLARLHKNMSDDRKTSNGTGAKKTE